MNFDWTVNITGLLTMIGLATGGIVAWVTTINRVAAHDKALADTAVQIGALMASLKLMQDRTEDIRAKSAQELAEFKLEVAKSYATNAAIQQVEERVVSAIEKLGERFDRAMDAQRVRREPP